MLPNIIIMSSKSISKSKRLVLITLVLFMNYSVFLQFKLCHNLHISYANPYPRVFRCDKSRFLQLFHCGIPYSLWTCPTSEHPSQCGPASLLFIWHCTVCPCITHNFCPCGSVNLGSGKVCKSRGQI